MKLFFASAALILFMTLPGFCQNTSLNYGLVRPANPNRQVPSGSFFLAQPGSVNSNPRFERGFDPALTHSTRLRKKSNGRVYTSEPRIILVEPDLKDKPVIE
jgi:hypothetical protein